jgi:membrane protease YdiL (CAAX protease family)
VSKTTKTTIKVSRSVGTGIFIYVVYLAIFYATWAINGVKYTEIGQSTETIKLWYAIPTLLASSFVLAVVTLLGWWKDILYDKKKSEPKWALLLPTAMLIVILANFTSINFSNLTYSLLFWSIAGGIGVGLGEEIITRGSLLIGLRTKYNEGLAWLISTLIFAALHIPNIFFGLAFHLMIVQVFLTFIMGTAFYVMRRISGTLIVAIVLHGLWDTSVFLPQATGTQGYAVLALVVYLLAIICAIPVLKNNWKLKLNN